MKYVVHESPGETVGEHLPGSGTTAWSSLEDCISHAVAKGHEPGSTLRYIQKSGDKCYYYGPGNSSGAAGTLPGTKAWRIDPTSALEDEVVPEN